MFLPQQMMHEVDDTLFDIFFFKTIWSETHVVPPINFLRK
jgi:hypothetical protein